MPTTISYKHMNLLKSCIILLNFLLWLFGWAILGIGIWLRVDPKSYEPSRFIDTDNILHASMIMIITGFIILLLGFVGLIGVITENPCLLATYFTILICLFVMQIAAIVLGIFHGFGERLEIFSNEEILQNLQQAQYNDQSRRFLDFFQVKLGCCGAQSFNDYARYGMTIPTSCYLSGTTYVNEQGCGRALRRFLELRSGIIGLLCLFSALIQLLLIGLSITLFCAKQTTIDSMK
ncbi:tetraspanin-4-like [Oppia nitens]|uniref:tetraspanin-4-like n=1 Tax=Oppia nitens TaxID=1686743 RepID=UPI0023DC3B8B|nr:tetraspanin-4-like [Oppia nitens]